MWYTYTMEYYSAIKKNGIMPFAATWMDTEIIIRSEVTEIEKDKSHYVVVSVKLLSHEQQQVAKSLQHTRLHCPSQKNPRATVHGVTKSQTQLSDLHNKCHMMSVTSGI